MKKSIGSRPYIFPMPVLLVATYCDDGSVDVMNMAWGGICSTKLVELNIDHDHKTMENILKRGAFTISIADVEHMKEADFFGVASANRMPDKFERSGLHSAKSENVDAPVVEEFPVTLECRVVECERKKYSYHVVGEIVNVLVEENVLGKDGKVDVERLNALIFDTFRMSYYTVGKKVGQAFSIGNELKK